MHLFCHEEMFALMQAAQVISPHVKVLVNKLRAAFHKDRPHPTCNDKHLKAGQERNQVVTFKCSCGTTFDVDYGQKARVDPGANLIFDCEINSTRPQCPNCGATT